MTFMLLLAGLWIIDVDSREESIEWARSRCARELA